MLYKLCSYKFSKPISELCRDKNRTPLPKTINALNKRVDKELSGIYNIGNFLIASKAKEPVKNKKFHVSKQYFYWFVSGVDENVIKCAVAINDENTDVEYFNGIKKIIEKFIARKCASVETVNITVESFEQEINNAVEAKFVSESEELNSLAVFVSNAHNIDSVDAQEEIDALIGLSSVKEKIKDILIENKINKLRKEYLNYVPEKTMHMCFYGNPGTCKTTVARIIAKLLKQEKLLDKGQFIEVSRSDLVEKYVGWTARNVKQKVKEAQGGILFIDEAYSLCQSREDTFGNEAVDTLVKEIEDSRNNMIVILAGYPKKMQKFLNANEGLRSRIAYHINFPDYSVDELEEILKLMVATSKCKANKDFLNTSRRLFNEVVGYLNFSNGRFVRTFVERALTNQARRIDELINSGSDKRKIVRELKTLRKCDLDTDYIDEFKNQEYIN